MSEKIHPIILAGGSGTRLWPLSREKSPKQFIPFINKRSLFQEACLRFSDPTLFAKPLIITHEEHRFVVREQLQEIGLLDIDIIVEPLSQNTAPASLAAALYLQKKLGTVPLLITPADHLTSNDGELTSSIQKAHAHIMLGSIGVFGIQPTRAHCGYGYLVRGNKLSDNVYQSSLFIEKPNEARAQELIEKENALWNSGLYFVTNDTLINEMEIHEQDMHGLVSEAVENTQNLFDYISLPKHIYEKIIPISIDKAVSERSNKVIVIETAVTWTDLGSWAAVHEHFGEGKNSTVTRGDVLALNTHNSYIESTHRLVAIYGLKDIGIVETKDAVAIFPLSESENIKFLVQELTQQTRTETDTHLLVKRPWGEYEILDIKENYQLKRLTVYPGGSSSLQRHRKRSEHWLIIDGVASVIKDNEFYELHPNDTIYIPVGSLHKIENKTNQVITLIETQTGTYFGEDDIERLDDKYGRV